jgi:hypothetical protein
LDFEGKAENYQSTTRMQRILDLSQLSERTWAKVLGKTHPTIGNWKVVDPPSETERLAQISEALDYALRRRGGLRIWLETPLPGLTLKPLDLIAKGRLRAFRGAVHARPASKPDITSPELLDRLRLGVGWPVAEVEPTPDDDD